MARATAKHIFSGSAIKEKGISGYTLKSLLFSPGISRWGEDTFVQKKTCSSCRS